VPAPAGRRGDDGFHRVLRRRDVADAGANVAPIIRGQFRVVEAHARRARAVYAIQPERPPVIAAQVVRHQVPATTKDMSQCGSTWRDVCSPEVAVYAK
jgi:hypothetical protein